VEIVIFESVSHQIYRNQIKVVTTYTHFVSGQSHNQIKVVTTYTHLVSGYSHNQIKVVATATPWLRRMLSVPFRWICWLRTDMFA